MRARNPHLGSPTFSLACDARKRRSIFEPFGELQPQARRARAGRRLGAERVALALERRLALDRARERHRRLELGGRLRRRARSRALALGGLALARLARAVLRERLLELGVAEREEPSAEGGERSLACWNSASCSSRSWRASASARADERESSARWRAIVSASCSSTNGASIAPCAVGARARARARRGGASQLHPRGPESFRASARALSARPAAGTRSAPSCWRGTRARRGGGSSSP